jgi:hypothetical protein
MILELHEAEKGMSSERDSERDRDTVLFEKRLILLNSSMLDLLPSPVTSHHAYRTRRETPQYVSSAQIIYFLGQQYVRVSYKHKLQFCALR